VKAVVLVEDAVGQPGPIIFQSISMINNTEITQHTVGGYRTLLSAECIYMYILTWRPISQRTTNT
jgi:hypothetical protein